MIAPPATDFEEHLRRVDAGELDDRLDDLVPDDGTRAHERAAAVPPISAYTQRVQGKHARFEPADDQAAQRERLRAAHRPFDVRELVTPPPPQRFVVHPYLPAGCVSILAGPGQMNKTTWTTGLAVARALGRSYLGVTPTTGTTAIVTTEDRRVDYLRKLAALRHELGDDFDAAAVAERVRVFDCAGVPVRLVQQEFGQFRPTSLPEDLADVLHECAPDTDLVVMETVSRLAGGAETNESLAILVEAGQRICRLTGAAVLLVSHVSQDAARRGVADAYAPRGGSAFGDNGRSTVVLTRLTADNIEAYAPGADVSPRDMECLRVLVHAKCNSAIPADPVVLERVSTPFGPVLRRAELRTRQAEDPAALIDRLRDVVTKLTAGGHRVTRTKLRDYLDDIGSSKGALNRLIDEAIAAGAVSEVQTGGRGGGLTLVSGASEVP